MKKLKTICLILITLLTLTACGGDKWQESYDLGMRYLSEGNYAEAIIAFDKAIKIDPKQPMAYVGRADAHIASGETVDNLAVAFADYTAALELDETNANAWLGLADVYIRQGEFEKAMETLQEALVKTNNADIIADKLAEIEAGTLTDSSGNIRRMNGYDENGNLVWYHIYSYNEKGRTSAVTAYNSQNQQIGHVDKEYDEEGRKTVDCIMNSTTGEIIKCVYIYDNNGNIVKELRGNREEIVREYNADNKVIRWSDYRDGKLSYYIEYEYKDGQMIKETSYSAQGECRGYIIHEYDIDGKHIKLSHYDANGTMYEYWINSYNENGKRIGTKYYDAEGKLLRSAASE